MKNASVFSPKATAKQRIFMDGLNFHSRFLPGKGRYLAFKQFSSRIENAVNAFKNSGFELIVFIDANRVSEEANEKYCSRQEQNIRSGKSGAIPFKELMLGCFFEKAGIPVLYSFDADNDDTLAVYAEKYNAHILSGDQDFFRYRNTTFQIYRDFTVNKNKILLEPSVLNEKKRTKARDLLSEMPRVIYQNPCISSLEAGIFRKGRTTPLIKELGNPVIHARALRAAMYSKLGYAKIKEVLPYWNGTDVSWTNEIVHGDPTFEHLLFNPIEARNTFLSTFLTRPDNVDDRLWEQHLFGVNGCIAEICCIFKGTFNSIMVLLTFGEFRKQ